jgi:hypothetical protein
MSYAQLRDLYSHVLISLGSNKDLKLLSGGVVLSIGGSWVSALLTDPVCQAYLKGTTVLVGFLMAVFSAISAVVKWFKSRRK